MVKKYPKQLKDFDFLSATIKIRKIREVFKERNGQSFKDKLICCEVKHPTSKTTTCFGDNRDGHRELIKFLRGELYLKK